VKKKKKKLATKKNDESEENELHDNPSKEEIAALRNNSNIVTREHYQIFEQVLDTSLNKQGDQSFSETQTINFMNWQGMIKSILNPHLPRQQPRQKPPKSWSVKSWWRPFQTHAYNQRRSPRPFDFPIQQAYYDEYGQYDRWGDRRWRDNYNRTGGDQDWGYDAHGWQGRNRWERRNEWAWHEQQIPWHYKSMRYRKR